MKIRDVITKVDDIKPNSYSEEDKLQWLEDIENKIHGEIVMQYVDPVEMTDFSDDESELIAPNPYDNLYISYIIAKIDFYNNETTRYNNSMIMFNEEYQAFINYYNRTHTHI